MDEVACNPEAHKASADKHYDASKDDWCKFLRTAPLTVLAACKDDLRDPSGKAEHCALGHRTQQPLLTKG